MAETMLQECLPLAENKSGRPIYLPVTILLLQTQVCQRKITAAAAIERLESLLPAYPDPATQAALYDAIWQLDSTRRDAHQKAAGHYQVAHEKFPHILFRQRYSALIGSTLPLPNITMETVLPPTPHSLDHLYSQLMVSLAR